MKNLYLFIMTIVAMFYFISCTNIDDSQNTKQDTPGTIAMTERSTETEEYLSTKIVTDMQEFQKYKLPLIAAIPEREIYLYAAGNNGSGVLLFAGDKKRVYDWVYSTNGSWIGINIFLADFDDDGIEELAVTCVEGTGTGCFVMELYMVDIYKDRLSSNGLYHKEMFTSVLMAHYGGGENFKYDNYQCTDSYEIEKTVSYYKDEIHYIDITVNGKTTTHNIDYIHDGDGNKANEFIELMQGEIFRVNVEGNKIKLEIQLIIDTTLIKQLYFHDTLYADVIYRDNQFHIENYRFSD